MTENTQNRTELLNEFLNYKEQYFKDDSILDAIQEFAFRKDLDAENLAREFAEDNAFQIIVEKDLKKFKFSRIKNNEQDLDAWE